MSGFEIGARPVSNADYRKFRSAHESPGDNADAAPVTGVSWDDARAYCDWLSSQTGQNIVLPTEAMWERAARGGLEQKKYPWGDEPMPDGTERANPYGVYAISYMRWEWTADWYKGTYYGEPPATDPQGPDGGVYRVLRGGGYRNDPASATVYTRGSARPETKSERVTFRVARRLGGPPPPLVTSASPPPPRRSAPAPASPPPASRAPAVPAGDSASQATRPASPSLPAPKAEKVPGSEAPGGPVDISNVSFSSENGAVTIKVATSGVPRFKAFALKAPDRLVVDVLDGTGVLSPLTGTVKVGGGGVKAVRYSQFQQSPPIFRTVIDLEQAMKYQVEVWPGELRVRLQP
jgi:hypothetical protein